MQKYQNARKKKKSDYDINKQNVTIYVSSVIGALQGLEYKFLNKLDKADQAIANSISNVMSQLNNLIEVSIYYIRN